jgi:hypothetical protein
MSVGVLDHEGMFRLLQKLEGRRFLGVLDCRDCLELVFEESEKDGNLVTLYTEAGRHTGLVAFGFVSDADAYIADWHTWLEEAA